MHSYQQVSLPVCPTQELKSQVAALGDRMREVVMQPQHCLQFLRAGRIVAVRDGEVRAREQFSKQRSCTRYLVSFGELIIMKGARAISRIKAVHDGEVRACEPSWGRAGGAANSFCKLD